MEYRDELERAYSNACDNYDKALLSLSGGALGISMAFIKNIIRDRPVQSIGLLLSAWSSWAASLLFVIASFYFSRRAIEQVIDMLAEKRTWKGRPGGVLAQITESCAILSGVAFLLGVVLMICFVAINLGGAP